MSLLACRVLAGVVNEKFLYCGSYKVDWPQTYQWEIRGSNCLQKHSQNVALVEEYGDLTVATVALGELSESLNL